MGAVTATITVSFASGSGSGKLTAEIDSRPESRNAGKTTFLPGDDVDILVRRSPDVTVTAYSTTGSITYTGETGVTQEVDSLTYVNSKTANLSKVPQGAVTRTWQGAGRNLGGGGTTVIGDVVSLNVYPADVNVTPVVGLLKAEYEAPYEIWRLSSIPSTLNGSTNFAVLVAFFGAFPS